MDVGLGFIKFALKFNPKKLSNIINSEESKNNLKHALLSMNYTDYASDLMITYP